jgi:hypothetical protein
MIVKRRQIPSQQPKKIAPPANSGTAKSGEGLWFVKMSFEKLTTEVADTALIKSRGRWLFSSCSGKRTDGPSLCPFSVAVNGRDCRLPFLKVELLHEPIHKLCREIARLKIRLVIWGDAA